MGPSLTWRNPKKWRWKKKVPMIFGTSWICTTAHLRVFFRFQTGKIFVSKKNPSSTTTSVVEEAASKIPDEYMPRMTWHEEKIRLSRPPGWRWFGSWRWFDPFIFPAKISILGVSLDATFPPWWSRKRMVFLGWNSTGFQEALIFFRTTWSDEWSLKIVCKVWTMDVLEQLWFFTCIWDEISRHVSLFAKHCLLDICRNQCRVRHSPSTFREVQQHFERVDQLHSIINTCIDSSNKHSYMYRVLSGSSHLVSGNHRVKNHGDRKSPNCGCGTPFKWLFHGL